MRPLFNTVQWIAWLGATISAATVACAFAFTTFETKDEAKDFKADIVYRLSRIENKVDELMKRKD